MYFRMYAVQSLIDELEKRVQNKLLFNAKSLFCNAKLD